MFKVVVEFCREEDLIGELPWGIEYSGSEDPQVNARHINQLLGLKLAKHAFWLTEDTTFGELYKDAVRYFIHQESKTVIGGLYNGRFCEWKREGPVLSYLSACPNEQLRRIILKVKEAHLWEQNDYVEDEKQIKSSVGQQQSEVSTLNPYTNIKNDDLVNNKEKDNVLSNRSLLEQNIHKQLRGIYTTYCLHGKKAEESGISLQEFQRFVNDCKFDAPRERVTIIFVSEKEKGYNGFLNMLLSLSKLKYPLDTPQSALERFIQSHVAPYSDKWSTCEIDGYPGEWFFEHLEQSHSVKNMVGKFSKSLLSIFQTYCLCDPSTKHKTTTANKNSDIQFLTHNQFQLFIQDFELFSIGSHLDARLCLRIFLTCCDFHGTSKSDFMKNGMKNPNLSNSRMLINKFIQALYRLSVMLAIPFELFQNEQQKNLHYQCVARALGGNPTLPLKGLLQHMHFNIFCRSYKLKALCRKVENRHWRKGKITPLGSQQDILNCAKSLEKEFIKMWQSDGSPSDYFSIVQEQVQTRKAEANFESGVVNLNENQQMEMNNNNDTEMDNNQQENNNSLAYKSAEESFNQASEQLRQLVDNLGLHIRDNSKRRASVVEQKKENHHEGKYSLERKKLITLERVVESYQKSNVQFSTIVRMNNHEKRERVKAQWKWAICLVGFVSKLLVGTQSILSGSDDYNPSGWLNGSWDVLIPKRRSSEKALKPIIQLLKLCEFSRACLEQADTKFKSISSFVTETEGSVSEYKLALDQASVFRMIAQIKIIIMRLKLVQITLTNLIYNSRNDLTQLLRNVAKGAMEADHYFGKAATYYEKVRFSKYFRLPLLNNWSFVLFEKAMSKATVFCALLQCSKLNTSTEKGLVPNREKTTEAIDSLLKRAREIASLGFELEISLPSNKEWFTPIALLWVWGNCLSVESVTERNLLNLPENLNRQQTEVNSQSFGQTLVLSDDSNAKGSFFRFEKTEEANQFFTNKAIHAVHTIFELHDKKKVGFLSKAEIDSLLQHSFCWDKDGYYRQTLVSQMQERVKTSISRNAFSSIMLSIAFSDPLGFVKILWSSNCLKTFGFVDASGYCSKKVPTNLLVTTLLYQSFEESNPRTRLRRMHNLRRIKTPSPLTFVGAFGSTANLINGEEQKDGTSSLEDSSKVTLQGYSADRQHKLVDYFVVLDAHTLDGMADLDNVETAENLPLKPRIRSVWPPKVEDLLCTENHGFTSQDLASIRALYDESPLPEDLPLFCFRENEYHPKGIVAGKNSPRLKQIEEPVLQWLVLTDSGGIRRFGVFILFYEEIDIEKKIVGTIEEFDSLIESCKGKRWYVPTILCLLSRWPFYNTFEKVLLQTFRISRNKLDFSQIPLERYICNFVNETPVPPCGGSQIQMVMGDTPIYLKQPAKNELPLAEFSFVQLVKNLNEHTILTVFSCLLQEQKIALCSSDETLLTPIAEAFRSIMFPFELECIYIPTLPDGLTDFLFAPVPFFMGINSSFISAVTRINSNYKYDESCTETDDIEEYDEEDVNNNSNKNKNKNKDDNNHNIIELDGVRSFSSSFAIKMRRSSSLGVNSNPLQNISNKKSSKNENNTRVVAKLDPSDVVFVDIDRDKIILPLQPNGKPLKLTPLPKTLKRKLLDKLERCREEIPQGRDPFTHPQPSSSNSSENDNMKTTLEKENVEKFKNLETRTHHARTDHDSATSRVPKPKGWQEHIDWTKGLRDIFLQFHVKLLRNYKRYIVREKNDIDWYFDKLSFLADHTSLREFCKNLLNTQHFECFIRDCISVLNNAQANTPRKYQLQLFDEYIATKENKSKTNRIYSRQKKQPTPLLSSTHGAITKTIYVDNPEPLPPQESMRSSNNNFALQNKSSGHFPLLDPFLLRSTRELNIPKVDVEFYENELELVVSANQERGMNSSDDDDDDDDDIVVPFDMNMKI